MHYHLASIVAEYARHTEVEKLILVFDDQEAAGHTTITIPIGSKHYVGPLTISWSRWRHDSKKSRDGRFYTFNVTTYRGSAYRTSDRVDGILPSNIQWMDELGDKYKKIGAAYQTFMADAMARF
jgi:hypothetical protein